MCCIPNKEEGSTNMDRDAIAAIQECVIDVVFEQLRRPGLLKSEITRETGIVSDLGADSLDITNLVMELEEEFSEGDFDLNIPDDAKLPTVGQIIDFIVEEKDKLHPAKAS